MRAISSSRPRDARWRTRAAWAGARVPSASWTGWRSPPADLPDRRSRQVIPFPTMNALALHTWTVDTTPLADALRIARRAGWQAVELRRLDFTRAAEAGHTADAVVRQVRASALGVACVGVEFGWMWTEGEERQRLLSVFAEQCARAAALACNLVMSPVDKGRGGLLQAAASVREVGDIAAGHGVRVAIEFNSQCEQLNALAPMREVLARAGHPRCGLLLDTYHIGRSGCTMAELEDVTPAEITYV